MPRPQTGDEATMQKTVRLELLFFFDAVILAALAKKTQAV